MTSSADFEYLGYELEDGILTVTFDRQDKLNAISPPMMSEIVEALDRADRDDDVRVVVFTGAGRAFCAGADLTGAEGFASGDAGDFSMEEHAELGGTGAMRLFRCLKPTIAAINGPAVGIGATLTLPMDLRLAADTARLGFVFTRRGIVPESCSSWFLPRIVGIAQALEWVATARMFDAEEALRGGLVRSVHPAAGLLSAAQALAREIADGTAPVSMALARQLMWGMLAAEHPRAAHEAESRAMHFCAHSPDAREGIGAFFDRRPPEFRQTISGDLPRIPGLPYAAPPSS